jgi:hypothetical protein
VKERERRPVFNLPTSGIKHACGCTICHKKASGCGYFSIEKHMWPLLRSCATHRVEAPCMHQSTRPQTFHYTSLILCRPRRVWDDEVSTGASSPEDMTLQVHAAAQLHRGSKYRNNNIVAEHGHGTLTHDRELWQCYPLRTAANNL